MKNNSRAGYSDVGKQRECPGNIILVSSRDKQVASSAFSIRPRTAIINAEESQPMKGRGHCPRLVIDCDVLQQVRENGIRNCRAGNISPIIEA